MKKKILLMVVLIIVVMTMVCSARALPNTEFTLGGIGVANGTTMSYVRSIYGNPRITFTDGFTTKYKYGDSIEISAWKSSSGDEYVCKIVTTANNGFGTPAGLTVGMNKSIMEQLYGEPLCKDKENGLYEAIYGHEGRGAGASMRIYWDKKNIIRRIECVN